jgi:hypothetical protein
MAEPLHQAQQGTCCGSLHGPDGLLLVWPACLLAAAAAAAAAGHCLEQALQQLGGGRVQECGACGAQGQNLEQSQAMLAQMASHGAKGSTSTQK